LGHRRLVPLHVAARLLNGRPDGDAISWAALVGPPVRLREQAILQVLEPILDPQGSFLGRAHASAAASARLHARVAACEPARRLTEAPVAPGQ
jgi:hypothetical protein